MEPANVILPPTPARLFLACGALGLSFAGLVVTMMMATSTTYTPISPMISPTFFGWWVCVIEGSFAVVFTIAPRTTYRWIHGYDYKLEASVSRLRGEYLFSFFMLSMVALLPKTPQFIGHLMLALTARHIVGIAFSNLTHFHTTLTHLVMLWSFFPICIVPMLLLQPTGFAMP